jgi:hypothetical protein
VQRECDGTRLKSGVRECVLSLRWEAKVTLVSHHEIGVVTSIRNVSQQTVSRGEVSTRPRAPVRLPFGWSKCGGDAKPRANCEDKRALRLAMSVAMQTKKPSPEHR